MKKKTDRVADLLAHLKRSSGQKWYKECLEFAAWFNNRPLIDSAAMTKGRRRVESSELDPGGRGRRARSRRSQISPEVEAEDQIEMEEER